MRTVATSWNKVVKSLIATKYAWLEFVEVMEARPEIPAGISKIVSSSTPRARFSNAIPDIIHYARVSGVGIDGMLFHSPEPEVKLKKEGSKDEKDSDDGKKK